MLDLYKLEIFRLVTQTGSFSGAAERLLMSQSGVSQHIQELESSLGTQLFVRGRRGVLLTPSGQVLDGYAKQILQLVAEAEAAISDVEKLTSGQVAIGATPGVAVYWLPEWVQNFRERYPKLTVSLQTDITSEIVAAVLANRLDLGVIEGELDTNIPARLGRLGLQEVSYFVVVGQKHPWWQVQSIHLNQLQDQRLIMRQPSSQTRIWLDGLLREYNLTPSVVAEFDNLESIKRAVVNSTAVSILPDYVLHQERALGLLHPVAVVGNPLERVVKLVWDRSKPFSPVARAFVLALRKEFPQIQEVLEKLF